MGWIHGAITLIMMITFIGIVIWAWRDERASAFDEAARLPLRDDGRDDRNDAGRHEAAP